MYKAINNIREQKGFTLIELLIVVAIIGILAAIAIPGYIGMQEKARKGAIQRSATSVVPEIQAWLLSARGGLGSATEIDTNFDGTVSSGGGDLTNSALASQGVDSIYVTNRLAAMSEKSPWNANTSLWVIGSADDGTSTSIRLGQITISSTTMGIRVVARSNQDTGVSTILVNKIVSAE